MFDPKMSTMTTEDFTEMIRAGAALLSRRRRLQKPRNARRAYEKEVLQWIRTHPRPIAPLEDGETYLTLAEFAKVLRTFTRLPYTRKRLKVIAGQEGWAPGFDRVLVGPVNRPWAATIQTTYGTKPHVVMRAALLEPSYRDAAVEAEIIMGVRRYVPLSQRILQYVREHGMKGLSYRELRAHFKIDYEPIRQQIQSLEQHGALQLIQQNHHGFVAKVKIGVDLREVQRPAESSVVKTAGLSGRKNGRFEREEKRPV